MTTTTDQQEPTVSTTAAEPEATPVPAVREPRRPALDFDTPESLKARLAGLMRAVPYHEDEAEEPIDDMDELRRKKYTEVWQNSLKSAHVEDLAHWTLSDLGPDQHAGILEKYVRHLRDEKAAVLNLVLGGAVGSGKTTAAIAAGNTAVEQGLTVRFVQHATYLRWLRPDGAPNNMPDWQIRNRFLDVDLLILDDFAAGLDVGLPATKFVRDETTALVGDRIDTGKATIITTNVRAEDLEVMIDDRLVSRLSKRGHAVRFAGQDRRGRLSW